MTTTKGDGATVHIGSDSYAATVIKTTPKSVTIQYDEALLVQGSGDRERQTYQHIENPKGEVKTFRLNKRGHYMNGPYVLSIGQRRSYRDPSF